LGVKSLFSRRFAARGCLGIIAFLICAVTLALVEQKRTEADLGVVLSAYLSEGILHDAHDWGSGRGILVVLQREAQSPGSLRSRLLYPFVRGFEFSEASLVTRISFAISNALPSHQRPVLQLPSGVNAVLASRADLERAGSSSEFEEHFPNNFGYIAVSRPGFNFDRTEAIFYIDHFCGLCGGGTYVLMRKVNGVWAVVNQHSTWVS
jgi:hypothetical protein